MTLEDALEAFVDPVLGTGLVSSGVLRGADRSSSGPRISIDLGFPAARYRHGFAARLQTHLRDALGIEAAIDVDWKVAASAPDPRLGQNVIANVIAVASGKGGVGKSTVSVNLALALAAEGAKVGILDADIYGPSVPRMLGATGRYEGMGQGPLEPAVAHGIKVMSIGLLVDDEQPMIWRGPMVSQAFSKLFGGTSWGRLDYLVLDLPPGTGDVQLTLSQQVPVSGAVIVTTPQDIALLDARRAVQMFNRVHVPVLGVAENMSWHACSQCGHREHIFGDGGGERMARRFDTELLGQIPLNAAICEHMEQGAPTLVTEPDGPIASVYRQIALKAAARLATGKGEAAPEILVTDD